MTSTALNTTGSRRRRRGSPASTRTRPSATLDTVVAMRRAASDRACARPLASRLRRRRQWQARSPRRSTRRRPTRSAASTTSRSQSFANPKNLSDLAEGRRQDAVDPRSGDRRPQQAACRPRARRRSPDQWLAQVRNLKDDLQEIRDKAKANDMDGVQDVVPKATDHNSKSNRAGEPARHVRL